MDFTGINEIIRIPMIDLERLIAISCSAAEAILDVYSGPIMVEQKDDASPLTEADRRSNAVILAALEKYFPGIPVLSEETQATDFEIRRHWHRYFLVDPLDGTKEFIKRNGEFTVNIALVEDGIPVAGVVQRPTTGEIFAAANGCAFRRGTDGNEALLGGNPHYSTMDRVVVVASRSHLTPEVESFIAQLREAGREVDFLSAGSSLKICLVASGEADVYPRFGPTMEWDTAAAHAVAIAAGRRVLSQPGNEPLQYNKQSLLNPHFIVE